MSGDYPPPRATQPPEHSLDVLRTSLRANETAIQTSQGARALADLAVQQNTDLVGKVAVLEDRTKTLDGKLDRVLERLGQLAEASWWDRALKRGTYALAAAWVLWQFYRAARGDA